MPSVAHCLTNTTVCMFPGAYLLVAVQSGQPSLDLNMLDRHEHIRDLDHVWSDPPGATNIYGPRRFEGRLVLLVESLWVSSAEPNIGGFAGAGTSAVAALNNQEANC